MSSGRERVSVSAALLNIVIGLVTSVVSGAVVWLWQRGKVIRARQRRAAFFGLFRGGTCLMVVNNTWAGPGSTSHRDVQALIEIASLATTAECALMVRTCDELQESNGDRTEFCVGGPESNPRTAGHLLAQVPGVSVRRFDSGRADSAALVVGERQFQLRIGQQEYAVVAKFTPPGSTRPVIVICGQTSMTNWAAIHYLKQEYRELAKMIGSLERFCIVLRVSASGTYGHLATTFEGEVSAAAFAPA